MTNPTPRVRLELAHPYEPAKRLYISASSPEEAAEIRKAVDGWVRDYKLHHLSLPELRDRVQRLQNARGQTLVMRDAWDVLLATALPSMLSRLNSIWRKQVAPELAELPVVQMTGRRLTQWDLRLIKEGYAPKTVHDTFAQVTKAVRGVLRDGEDLPWRIAPGKYWRPSRRPDALKETPACVSVDEAHRLIEAALEEDREQRASEGKYATRLADFGNRCAVVLFLALRNGEGAGLGWDDIARRGDHTVARICHQAIDQWRRFHPGWTRPLTLPKWQSVREIVVHPTAAMALGWQRELLEQRGWYREDGPVFPGHEGTAFAGTWRNNANVIRPEYMKRLAKSAGLPFPDDWVTHSLRHSLATLESVSGADLRSIQGRTGHSSLETLETYIHARVRGLVPSAVPQLELTFGEEHDTEKDLPVLPDDST